jgi:polar amino acid transport system substrate-binding protein
MVHFLRGCRHGLPVVLATMPWLVQAQCSRPMRVPVAPIGLSVQTAGDTVSGLYPDLLRQLADKNGCVMAFSVVPRARQEAMFESGSADLLVPATRTERRDGHGTFVPMVSSRAVLISLQSERANVGSVAELLARKELRVVVVRGYDYGPAYQGMLKQLGRQGRLLQAADPVSAARMLAAGMAELTVMTSTIFTGALQGDARVRPLLERLRFEAVEELPWGESGIYVSSKAALDGADRALMLELLERSARSDAVWRAFQRYYPPASLTESIRPR